MSAEVGITLAMAVARERLAIKLGGLRELICPLGCESSVFAVGIDGVVVKFLRVQGLGAVEGGKYVPWLPSTESKATSDAEGMTPDHALRATWGILKAHSQLGPLGVAPLLWPGIDHKEMMTSAAIVMHRHEPLQEHFDPSWLVRKVIDAVLAARERGFNHGDLHLGQVLLARDDGGGGALSPDQVMHSTVGDGKRVVLVDWYTPDAAVTPPGPHPPFMPPMYGPGFCLRADDDWAIGCLAICALCPPKERWAFVRPRDREARIMDAWSRVLGEPPGTLGLVRAKFRLPYTKQDTPHPSLEEFVARFTALHNGKLAPLDDRTRFAWKAAWTLLRWRTRPDVLQQLVKSESPS